jgi:methionine sulfoxide reductase catalytic subunit
MFIRIPRGWEIPDREATPEHLVFGRRAALGGAAAGTIAGGILASPRRAAAAPDAPPPLPGGIRRNPRYMPRGEINAERDATTYNNYYEFGTDKSIHRAAQKLPQRPWTLKVDGLVARPQEFGIDDLLKRMPLEERVYRLRCVEAWAMTVPWIGFPLATLLREVEPQVGAKYVRFETAADPATMPGVKQGKLLGLPFPYIEGCTIEEAGNDLSFLVVGAYGKPLLPQNGGPIRVHQPWKYGFKGGKALVRITLTAERPKSFWEALQPSEYGFWANVNPAVAHPRWSQASERVLGTGERVPTLIFNGYGEFVADLYKGLEKERLWT